MYVPWISVATHDKQHKLLFSGDQIIKHIVPIVGTSYTNEHLLTQYFHSLEQFKSLCSVIIANRFSEELEDCWDKVYTRDIYRRD